MSDFTVVDTLTFAAGENSGVSAAIDPANGSLYFGTWNGPGKVVKVDLATFTRVGSITLSSGENWLVSAAIDTAGGFAYFGGVVEPGLVFKIGVGTEGGSPGDTAPYDIAVTGAAGGRFNMIGHPFVSSVDWSQVSVDVGGGIFKTVASLSDTEATSILASGKWEYNGTSYDYCDPRAVCGAPDDDTLVGFDGFWVKAFVDTTVRIPAAAAGFRGRSHRLQPNEWYVRLEVRNEDGSVADRSNLFGRLAGASDGLDSLDGEELMPFGPPYVIVVFPRPEWGGTTDGYTTDYRELRPGGGRRLVVRDTV